jgi:DNA-binding transcriptional regulator YiaG
MAKKATPIESLQRNLKKRFPDACFSLDRPDNENATWFLDVNQNGHFIVIQWRYDKGFGVSSSSRHAYGEGPDEVYQDKEGAYARTVSLLLSKNFTAPPEAVRLRELRKERRISQVELASKLNTQQGAVSRLERRKDMLVSTVRDVVRSMGGTLRIIAQFPDGMEKTLEFEDDQADAKSDAEDKAATS